MSSKPSYLFSPNLNWGVKLAPHFLWVFLIVLGLLGGCAKLPGSFESRYQQAIQLASRKGFKQDYFVTSQIPLVGFSKISNKPETLRIYIEGDGFAWATRSRPSTNPTPKNPVALKLALQDPAPSIVYLARPCQYTNNSKACQQTYWTRGRFSKKVIASFNEALDQLAQQYHVNNIELIGYSGGANIVAILAAHRQDVRRFVTVSGNLDHALWTRLQKISPLIDSDNAIHYAKKLKKIPQVHFIGRKDRIVPLAVSMHYKKTVNALDAQYVIREDQGHFGWEVHWQALLKTYL